MSHLSSRIYSMDTESPTARAAALGMDHAELDHLKRLQRRLRTGAEIAAALDLDHVPSRDHLSLREAYDSGWSSWA
jgi:hypothetical protein